jgi:hypothetical protein
MIAIKVKQWCSITRNYFAKASQSYKSLTNLHLKVFVNLDPAVVALLLTPKKLSIILEVEEYKKIF